MRMMLHLRMPDAEAGNRGVREGGIEKAFKAFIEQYKPEACYFFSDRGARAASFVFDMQDSSQIPAIVEPFFLEFNAEARLTPVMNLDDLGKGLSGLSM